MTTLDTIQKLSNERQALWRLAGRQKLNETQRARLGEIKGRLNSLWHEERAERVQAARGRVFIEDRVKGDTFCDFVAKLHPNGGQGSFEKDEVEGMDVRRFAWPKVQPPAEPQEHEFERTEVVDWAGVEVLREVLAELKRDDQAMREALKRATRHQMSLRELRQAAT